MRYALRRCVLQGFRNASRTTLPRQSRYAKCIVIVVPSTSLYARLSNDKLYKNALYA